MIIDTSSYRPRISRSTPFEALEDMARTAVRIHLREILPRHLGSMIHTISDEQLSEIYFDSYRNSLAVVYDHLVTTWANLQQFDVPREMPS